MRLPGMKSWANTPPTMVMNRRRPTSLALVCRGCGECEEVTWLALQCVANGLERGEADRACLAGFQDRQVGERDSDLLRQLRERHAALVEHVVELDDDRHGQT